MQPLLTHAGTLVLYLWALVHANAASEAERTRIFSPCGVSQSYFEAMRRLVCQGVVGSSPLFRRKIAILSCDAAATRAMGSTIGAAATTRGS